MINYSIFIMSTTPGTKKQDITETKAYGVAQSKETLDLTKFAEHITSHGCAYDRGDVAAILTKSVDCLREMMLEGKRVKLGELGTFHAELQTEGARTTDEFNANNIKEVNIRWTPGKRFQNLRDDAEFKLVPSLVAQADAIEIIKNEDTIQGLE